MKTLLPVMTLCALSFCVQADVMTDWQVTQLAKDPHNADKHLSVSQAMQKSPVKAAQWLASWDSHKHQAQYAEIWAELGFNMLRWSQPDKGYEWRSKVHVQGLSSAVYQQDSLIDLDRSSYAPAAYRHTTGSVHSYPMADIRNPPASGSASSQALMAAGYPPIGPDGATIQVCAMGASPLAGYLELSQTQSLHLAKTTQLDFSRCLKATELSHYWQERLTDFVDPYHDRTANHRPGTSW